MANDPTFFGGYSDYQTIFDQDVLKQIINTQGDSNVIDYLLKWNHGVKSGFLNFHRIWSYGWSVSTCAEDSVGEQHYMRQNDNPFPYDYDGGGVHQVYQLDNEYRTRLISNLDNAWNTSAPVNNLDEYFGRLRRLCRDARGHSSGPKVVQIDLFDWSVTKKSREWWVNPWNPNNQANTNNDFTTATKFDLFKIKQDGSDPNMVKRYNAEEKYVKAIVRATRGYGNVVYVVMNEPPYLNPLVYQYAPGGQTWDVYWHETVCKWIAQELAEAGSNPNTIEYGTDRAVGIIYQETKPGGDEWSSIQSFINSFNDYNGPAGRNQDQWFDFVSYHSPFWVNDSDCESTVALSNHINRHRGLYQDPNSDIKLDIIIDDDGTPDCRHNLTALSNWADTCFNASPHGVSFNHKDEFFWDWGSLTEFLPGDLHNQLCTGSTPLSCCGVFYDQQLDKDNAEMHAIGKWMLIPEKP